MKKKGPYRRVEKIEMIEDRGVLKKNEVIEVHPELKKMLVKEGKAKPSDKKLTTKAVIPTSKVKSEE